MRAESASAAGGLLISSPSSSPFPPSASHHHHLQRLSRAAFNTSVSPSIKYSLPRRTSKSPIHKPHFRQLSGTAGFMSIENLKTFGESPPLPALLAPTAAQPNQSTSRKSIQGVLTRRRSVISRLCCLRFARRRAGCCSWSCWSGVVGSCVAERS